MIFFRCETRRLECDLHTPALFGLCADGFYGRVQARLVSGRFVFMNQAMGHGSIDNRHGGCVGSCGYGLVAALDGRNRFLNCRSHSGSLAGVALASYLCLASALL